MPTSLENTTLINKAISSNTLPNDNLKRSFQYRQDASRLAKEPNIFVKGFYNASNNLLPSLENKGKNLSLISLLTLGFMFLYIRQNQDDHSSSPPTSFKQDLVNLAVIFLGLTGIKKGYAKIVEKVLKIPTSVKLPKGNTKTLGTALTNFSQTHLNTYDEVGEIYFSRIHDHLRNYTRYVPLKQGEKLLNQLPPDAKENIAYLRKVGYFDMNNTLKDILYSNKTIYQTADQVHEAIQKHIVPKAYFAKKLVDCLSLVTTAGLLWKINYSKQEEF